MVYLPAAMLHKPVVVVVVVGVLGVVIVVGVDVAVHVSVEVVGLFAVKNSVIPSVGSSKQGIETICIN